MRCDNKPIGGVKHDSWLCSTKFCTCQCCACEYSYIRSRRDSVTHTSNPVFVYIMLRGECPAESGMATPPEFEARSGCGAHQCWSPRGQVLVLEDPRKQFWSPWSWPCELSPWPWPRDSSPWKTSRTLFTNHCRFSTNDFKGNYLELCPLPITE